MEIKKASDKRSKVFLGGTCAESTWRDELVPMLEIDHFNPVVDEWNDEAQAEEERQKDECDFCLYVITPRMQGVYSIAEAVDDSNKRPDKVVFAYLEDDEGVDPFDKHQLKSLKATAGLVEENTGRPVLTTLEDIASYLNGA